MPVTEAPGHAARRVGRYEVLLELQDEGVVSRSVATVHGPNAGPRIVELSRVTHAVASQVEVRAAFLAEARAAGRVRHANFVHPTDTLLHEGVLYGVTEFTLGVRLEELQEAADRAGRSIPLAVVARVMLDVLAGASALHASSVHVGSRPAVHGDITPSTVIIGYRGDARLVFSGLATATTRAGTMGEHSARLAYKAPEQLRTGTTVPIAATADVFAVGVLLWECLGGGRLFDAPRDVDVVERILAAAIPFDSLERRVPPALVAVVGTALERSPERRFPSAAHFAEMLARAVEVPVASADDVAAFVDQLLGPVLERRREDVQGLVDRIDELAFSGPASRAGLSSHMRRAGSVRTPVGIIYPPAEVSPSSGRVRVARSLASPSGYGRISSGAPTIPPPSTRARHDVSGAARAEIPHTSRAALSAERRSPLLGLAILGLVLACTLGYACGRAGVWRDRLPSEAPPSGGSPARGY